MDVPNLTRDRVREILRASEGINTQLLKSKARISSDGRLEVGRMAHPIGAHLLSAKYTEPDLQNTLERVRAGR